ncbi:MAG: S-adenosylmethionine:tRNA ribosyltransferase-isomerase [Muribaculaceae bacterium]|nr:S-adenosylmethionine:tRNA ribosyltransferase-isomerase [Muribaculaceae bacterium]
MILNETDPRSLRIDQYDYQLPDERIARHPLARRDECMLLRRTADGRLSSHCFKEIADFLPAGTMLVYNNTRVINARLRFRKGVTSQGALIEVFCLEPVDPCDYAANFAATGDNGCRWLCFVGNSKRWKDGMLSSEIEVGGVTVTLTAERVGRSGNTSTVHFRWSGADRLTFSEIIAAAGELPIPPYLNRATEESDNSDYQTVFSHIDGSVAAPTAGLHFTPEVLESLDRVGVRRRELTLHVGAGTFQPVKSDDIGSHQMHSEFISVSRDLIAELARRDRPVVAVGTTSVRTLESLYHLGCRAAAGLSLDELPQWYPYEAGHPDLDQSEAMNALLRYLDSTGLDRLVSSTRVIIAPGYRYRMIDGMVTNFHQPRSTLLLLVSAFVGGDWRTIYDYALADPRYRFLSYGDACLLLR